MKIQFTVITSIIVLGTLVLSSLQVNKSEKDFSIAMGKFPYNESIEWYDKGILLFAHNPNNKTETMVTFVDDKHDNTFTESLNHQKEKYYIVQDAKSKYLYFFEDLEIKNGLMFYHQLSSSGDIKPQKISFNLMMKNLGNYPIDKMKIKDIIVCSKGVVLTFECEKDPNIMSDIAIIITDNNCLSYAVLLGMRDMKTKFKSDAYAYHYAGNNEKIISFSRKSQDSKKPGFEVVNYNYNGKLIDVVAVPFKKQLGIHQQTHIGQTGAYLFKKSALDFEGQVFTYNNVPYIFGYETVNGKVQLSCYAKNEKDEFVLKSAHSFGPKLDGNVHLGVEETNKGFLLRMGSSKQDICALMEDGLFETRTCGFILGLIENPFIAFLSVKPQPDRLYLGYSKSPEIVFSFPKKALNQKQAITFEAL